MKQCSPDDKVFHGFVKTAIFLWSVASLLTNSALSQLIVYNKWSLGVFLWSTDIHTLPAWVCLISWYMLIKCIYLTVRYYWEASCWCIVELEGLSTGESMWDSQGMSPKRKRLVCWNTCIIEVWCKQQLNFIMTQNRYK